MKKITQRMLIEEVSKSFDKNYPSDRWRSQEQVLISKRLRELDLKTASAKEIDDIIGNDSWTILFCHECRKQQTEIVQVGEEPDYESATANLCKECAEKALLMF